MTRMVQLVDEFRERLTTVADAEQKLVASLREALNRYDQKLLHDVRSLTAEHESRRGVILNELQGLASRVGAFPAVAPREPRPSLAEAAPPQARAALPPNGNAANINAANGNAKPRAVGGGAWREATDKLQTELDSYFKKRA